VSTTPSQPRPLPSRHRHVPELTCGFNNSNGIVQLGNQYEAHGAAVFQNFKDHFSKIVVIYDIRERTLLNMQCRPVEDETISHGR